MVGGPGSKDEWMDGFVAKVGGGRIPGLDGIRGVAVFLVILYHFGVKHINGPLGVEMFFTLSGFLITWLLLKEVGRTGKVSFRGFYKRRTLRIFPAFYAYLLFALVVYVVRGHDIPWGSVLFSAFYLQDYHLALVDVPNDFIHHTWSLSIEEQFYLLWPAVLFCFRHDLRRLTKVLVGIILATWIYRSSLYFAGVWQGYIYCAFDTRMDQLAVGCLLAVLVQRRALAQFGRFVTRRWYFPAVVLFLIGGSSLLHGNLAYRFIVGYGIEPILTAVLIIQVVTFSSAPVWRVFNGPVMSYLGKISYSLYLYQELTMFTAKRLTAGLPVAVQLGFAIAATIALAMASFYVVEQPLRALGRRPAATPSHEPALGAPGVAEGSS